MAMSKVHDKSLKILEDFLKSPEGEASIREFTEKKANEQKIAESRYRKFEKYLEIHDFEELMQLLQV